MTEALTAGLLFLINTIFNIYIFILIIRVILAFVGVNYFNPFVQVFIKLTDPLVKPLRQLIPNIKRIELSTLLIILLLEIIKYFLILLLTFGMPHLLGVIVLAVADMLASIITIFTFAIILQIILSWIQPHSSANALLYQIISPIVQPFRRLLPPVSGIDLSPIPALILLQLLSIILVGPLMRIGMTMTFG